MATANPEKKDKFNVESVEVGAPDEKYAHLSPEEENNIEQKMGATVDDIADAEEKIAAMPLQRCQAIMAQIQKMHRYDQNFPPEIMDKITKLLDDPDVAAHPANYPELIREMKLEALLVTENSPYAEVRAVVDPTDDPSLPSLTFRALFIGIVFAGAGAFINQLFSVRFPNVQVSSNVAQLLAWPFGKLLEKALPRGRLNPGPFNGKEHMLITIMATVAFNTPYTNSIIFTQALPMYFNQPYARGFGYQIINTLGSNFVGYGLAGLCRRFIVFPSFCVWPASLTALAINKAFHSDTGGPIPGPFRRTYTWSRMKLFTVAFVTMFIYFWFPGYIFGALSTFNWMSWIAPNNMAYNNIVGVNSGLGLNPIPTFDWNHLTQFGWQPMVIPHFAVVNQFLGTCISFFMIVGFYWSNAWDTGYLPINSNHIFDNTGALYNVSKVLDSRSMLDEAEYQKYSEPHMTAGNINNYFWFFAIYSCTMSYTFLYHRHELAHGFGGLWRSIRAVSRRRSVATDEADDLSEDVHWRLMKNYKEVPEWWYALVLCCALVLGMVGVGCWPTNTTPAVVIFGVIMALIFVIPVGLITAVTGIQVTLNVLAEFIGGGFAPGNALEVNYFKMYGYITTAQALFFSNDLKLAHYTKIPPRNTFLAQMIATLVSSFVCVAIYNFQMGFKGICTKEATFGMICPNEATFFTAAVYWGTIGPHKLFGSRGHYKALLAGFPVGFVMPFITFYLCKAFPRVHWLRGLHPVLICVGGLQWAPTNMSYIWPSVVVSWVSWRYVRPRFLAFWSRYNYVLAASWTAAVAIAAIVIFFAVQLPDVQIDWWGNNPDSGCEADGCNLLEIPAKGYFGPDPGNFS